MIRPAWPGGTGAARRAPRRARRGLGSAGLPGRARDRRAILPAMPSDSTRHILAAIQSGASGEEIAALELPDSYRAAFVRRDEVDIFEGLDSDDKDPRKSLHVDEVALPELAPDEAYVAVMA